MVNSWVVGQKGEFAVIVTPTDRRPSSHVFYQEKVMMQLHNTKNGANNFGITHNLYKLYELHIYIYPVHA